MGMLIGNLPFDIPNMAVVQKIATEATIPLAIPMMLFSCRFTRRDASTQLNYHQRFPFGCRGLNYWGVIGHHSSAS